MAAQIPADVQKFMRDYSVAHDEIWLVAGGKSYAIKHSALERIASESKIIFGAPSIVEANGQDGIATIIVSATMGEISEWSFGEASPKNNKNAYPFAMAEKRAKDRCTLKLLKAHGSIYSEDEADDFKASNNPQQAKKTNPADEISIYVARCKTGILNHTDREDLIAYWKQEQNARDVLRLKPGVPEYDDLFNAYKSHGAAITHREAAE